MSEVICPHCNATNASGTAFCESCGKAIAVQSDKPRVVEKKQVASMAIGQELQAEQLRQMAKRASTPLLVVGILNLVIGGLLLLVATRGGNRAEGFRIVSLAMLILGALFCALGVWAKFKPLPAAIVGLVLYLSLFITGVALNPLAFEEPVNFLIPIIIILALVRAVQAGVKHRKLKAMLGTAIADDLPAQEAPAEG